MADKLVELRHFQSLRRARPDLYLGDPRSLEDEKPDFIVPCGKREIGIEVTRFSPIMPAEYGRPDEQESLRWRVVNLASMHYENAGGAPLYIEIMFRDHPPLTKKRVPHLAEELARSLLGQRKSYGLYNRSALADYAGETFLNEIQRYSSLRVSSGDRAGWCWSDAIWPARAGEKSVAEVVAAKEKRLPTYLQRCSSAWLLIVFERPNGPLFVKLPFEPVSFSIQTGFERVFCLDPLADRCVEIPVMNGHG